MHKYLALSTLLISISGAYAQSNDERIAETFNKLHHKASINCEYSWWLDTPRVNTIEQYFEMKDRASATYQVGEDELKVAITAGAEKGKVTYEINGIPFSGILSKYNYIHLDLENLNTTQRSLSEKLDLENLNCSIEIAYEDNFEVTDKELHIAMHPYVTYDLDGESTAAIKEYVDKTDMQQVLLLDDVPNIRKGQLVNFNEFIVEGANYLETRNFINPAFEIPQATPLIVAPAGHLRFILKDNNHIVNYTGGNHNYCIMNSTRRLLNAFFDNNESETITINYITDAIVVQIGSYLKALKIPKAIFKQSNLLKNVLTNMSELQKAKYLDGHYNFYKSIYLPKKKYLFSKVKLVRTGFGATRTEIIDGKGAGTLEIIFNYK